MNQYTFEIQKPVVQTKFGQLRGVTYGDVNIFMGIPYARAKRFHMPEEPQAWTGIKNAYTYGPITPQMLSLIHISEPHLDPQRGIPGLYAPRRRLALS